MELDAIALDAQLAVMDAAVPKLRFRLDELKRMSPGKQAEAMSLMTEWERELQMNPLRRYIPAGRKHLAFHLSDARSRVFLGGNRAGKTTTAVVDDLIAMTPWELLPAHLQPLKKHECPFYCRLMAPDMKRTMIPVIHQKLKEWTPKELLRGGSFEKAYSKTDECLRLECGCRFDFLSYEMDLDKFGGAALHRCHYDEEPPEAIRNECRWRLIDFAGDELFSMTPLKGISWPFKHLWKRRGEMGNDGRQRIWAETIGTADNRTIDPNEIEQIKSEIVNEAELRQRLYGEFASRGGQIYPTIMDRVARNLTRAQFYDLVPRYDQIIVAIDPGVRWAGFTWIAFDRENHSLTFDAVKLTNADVSGYVDLLRAKEEEWGLHRGQWRPKYVIDPAARARSVISGTTFQSELQALGIPAVPGQNDVEAGISNIQRRLKAGSATIAPWCTELLDEAIEYAYEDREDEEFSVVKRNDHVLDSWRYGHMERPWLVDPNTIVLSYGPDRVPPPPRPNRDGFASVMGPLS